MFFLLVDCYFEVGCSTSAAAGGKRPEKRDNSSRSAEFACIRLLLSFSKSFALGRTTGIEGSFIGACSCERYLLLV
jgi:hypothetical protein